jgi:hypothetical protein
MRVIFSRRLDTTPKKYRQRFRGILDEQEQKPAADAFSLETAPVRSIHSGTSGVGAGIGVGAGARVAYAGPALASQSR